MAILSSVYILFSFFVGLFIGSFLNVVIDRIPRKEKLTGRSHCESCNTTLKWIDLIPVISFLWLRGKCRYCGKRFSYQYPLLELVTGILFSAVFVHLFWNISVQNLNFQLVFTLLFYLSFICVLILVFFIDLKNGIIPDKIILPAVAISAIWLLSSQQAVIFNHILSALGSFLFFLFIFLITRGKGMGFGDVKLAFFIGLVLGIPGSIAAFYIAFLTGGLIGLILVLWKKKRLNYAIPFGPFLVLGSLISLLLEKQITLLIKTFL